MNFATKIFSPLTHLLYPHICAGCGSDLLDEPNLLCLACQNEIPFTGFADLINNPVEKIFVGRLIVIAAMSELYFSKGTLVQSLVHQLKYKRNKPVGRMLGRMMGNSILNSQRFTMIDGLVALPLTAKKEYQRGYNQSALLCEGIRDVTNIPVIKGVVIKRKSAETQTKKRRSQRWQNVKESFAVLDTSRIKDKHILLVDDVITTGATLEACGKTIIEAAAAGLSIATLACASR